MIDATRRPEQLPGHDLRTDRMPGHWLLARLGKRVLRPGGIAMTQALLTDLAINRDDEVVELAPGLGVTARLILQRKPRSYTAVERDPGAAAWTRGQIPSERNISVTIGPAEATGLADGVATVVVGEAMLSMHSPEHKARIVQEAYRALRLRGRYAIHELAIVPDDVPAAVKQDIETALSSAIHVGARPLTPGEWRQLLESAGFDVERLSLAPMNLLRPARLIADEGLWGALKFVRNVAADSAARRRVLRMRRTFYKHRAHLSAISIIARK